MPQQPLPEVSPAPSEDSRARELVRLARHVWRLLTDARVPARYKAIPALALLYVISPVDLVPDSVPVLSQIDDLAVLLIAARLFVALADRIDASDAEGHDGSCAGAVDATYRVHDD